MIAAPHQAELVSLTHAASPMRFKNHILISRQLGNHSLYW
jgi:hypothetical protein